MIRILLALMLSLALPLPAEEIGNSARAGNPRGYETDILLETFGFDQESIEADIDLVFQGCSHRDCIPSIDEPLFQRPDEADYLEPDDLVLSVTVAGETRAYPTRILDRHEIVNDRFAGVAIAVTYCPLCGSGLAFKRIVNAEETELGVSGLLYNNDLIMYDRKTESLWQQITGRAIAGPRRGDVLEAVPVTMSDWAAWKRLNPAGMVLAPPLGAEYEKDAYGDYATSDRLLFPVSVQDARLHAKKVIFGVEAGGAAIAVDSQWLLENGAWEYEVDGRLLRLQADGAGGVSGSLAGEALPVHRMYWFAWYSFHPDTSLIDKDNH